LEFINLRQTAERKSAIEKLQALTELINQTVGDALSYLLLVETILINRQWTFKQWDQAYTDLQNRLMKVIVSIMINYNYFVSSFLF
jgi:phosphoacetylglucosamine mutase